jgi:carbamoyl-phosphate synthase small subunit
MCANMEARLVLEDGSLFKGTSRGAGGEAWGEVVFNTSMIGYQEIITDPASCGHILTMTFPLVGNYGINEEDFASRSPFLRGFVAREICPAPNNWRAVKTLGDYLQEQNIIAMDGVDTRALARLIREKGSLRGIITTADTPAKILLKKIRKAPLLSNLDLVSVVTTPRICRYDHSGPHLVILDLGLQLSLPHLLYQR